MNKFTVLVYTTCMTCSAHTFLSTIILLKYTLCLYQLYSYIVIQSVYTCIFSKQCMHFACPSYSTVQIKCTLVLVEHVRYNCTLPSASLACVLSINHRRVMIYLLGSDWSISHLPYPELELSLITAC